MGITNCAGNDPAGKKKKSQAATPRAGNLCLPLSFFISPPSSLSLIATNKSIFNSHFLCVEAVSGSEVVHWKAGDCWHILQYCFNMGQSSAIALCMGLRPQHSGFTAVSFCPLFRSPVSYAEHTEVHFCSKWPFNSPLMDVALTLEIQSVMALFVWDDSWLSNAV